MKIYTTCPSHAVLVAYAFQRFADARVIRLSIPSPNPSRPDLATFKDYPLQFGDPSRTVPYTFAPDYLWDLMKADQTVYEQQHPTAFEAQQQEELTRG